MILLGATLALVNVNTNRRDLALATGPKGEAQRTWLIEATDRPDVAQFFKNLSSIARTPEGRERLLPFRHDPDLSRFIVRAFR